MTPEQATAAFAVVCFLAFLAALGVQELLWRRQHRKALKDWHEAAAIASAEVAKGRHKDTRTSGPKFKRAQEKLNIALAMELGR